MKAQEELNNILLDKIHNDEKEKNKEPKHNMPKNTLHKRKGRKLEFSSEESAKHHIEKNKIPMKVVMIIKRKRITNHMKRFLGN